MTDNKPLESLFTYGSLQIPRVQLAVFGRLVEGVPDTLEGYTKYDVQFTDGIFPVIAPDNNSDVEGQIIEVTPEELVLIDRYETDAYIRIQVKLKSGRSAWVYARNDAFYGA